jgi:hypothetical protein
MTEPTKPAVLVVKRVYWNAFADGTKTIEYRRHRGLFTAKTFRPGRDVLIYYHYWFDRYPSLNAMVLDFTVDVAANHPNMLAVYPDLKPTDEVALIHLAVETQNRWKPLPWAKDRTPEKDGQTLTVISARPPL